MTKGYLKHCTFRFFWFKETHLESKDSSLSPGSVPVNYTTMTSYQSSLDFPFLIYEIKALARTSLMFHSAIKKRYETLVLDNINN